MTIDIILNGKASKMSLHNKKIFFSSVLFDLSSVRSLHNNSKDDTLLKLTTGDSEMLLKFENGYAREAVKSVFLALMSKRSISDPDTEQAYRLLVEGKVISEEKFWSVFDHVEAKSEIPKKKNFELENTKESLINLFVNFPILLYVYTKMNVSLSQFFNIFKQSYFYGETNKSPSVDRMIKEFIREYSNQNRELEDTVPSEELLDRMPQVPEKPSIFERINNISHMILMERDEIEKGERTRVFKEVNIQPEFSFKEKPKPPQNPPKIPSTLSITSKTIQDLMTPEIEEPKKNIKVDKGPIKKILFLAQMVYRTRKKGCKEIIEYATKTTEKIIEEMESTQKYPNIREMILHMHPKNFI